MTPRSKSYLVATGLTLAFAAFSPAGGRDLPLTIAVQDEKGAEISHSQPSTGSRSVQLAVAREYQPGDRIVVGGPLRLVLQLDENLPECAVYIPGGTFSYDIPYGRAEQQTGSAYAVESFTGPSHRIAIRAASGGEFAPYRNLALNPCDLQGPEDGAATSFPHATTNSVSRSLFDFAARNAIDGMTQNGHHGVWPYQSWGPQLRTDIWWKVDFGRPVELDKIRLMVRADFPHDSYWRSADVEFSDGSRLPLQIGASPEFQDFAFSKRQVTWLRITNVVPADPTKWCSFIEVEAWGRDLP